jgi:hypothetical protein
MHGKTRFNLSEHSPIYENYFIMVDPRDILAKLQPYLTKSVTGDTQYKELKRQTDFTRAIEHIPSLQQKNKQQIQLIGSPLRSKFIPKAAQQVDRNSTKIPNSNFSFEDKDNFGQEEKHGSVHSFPNIANTPPQQERTPPQQGSLFPTIVSQPQTRPQHQTQAQSQHQNQQPLHNSASGPTTRRRGGGKKSRKSKKKAIRKRR